MRKLLIAGLLLSASSVPVLAQSDDTAFRINQLEEQVRQLNGRVEELNFQNLELQERMRQMQEDNEFRFQQIEEKLGLGGGSTTVISSSDEENGLGKAEPSEQVEDSASLGGTSVTSNSPETIDGVEIFSGEPGVDRNAPGTLGTIQFDEDGNIVDTAIGKPLDLTSRLTQGATGGSGAMPDDPQELFDLGYEYIQSGRYAQAEQVYLTFSDRFPTDPKVAEARFWLGESYLGRGDFEQAAKIYLDAHKNWPDSRYGPQTLLKLGVSVAGLNQRELACATYAEVIEKYPDASRAVRRNVALEQRAANCLTN